MPFYECNKLGSSESPQQIDYEDCSKIDMFSLGVVLYNLAFEKFPYDLGKFFSISQETDEKDKYLFEHYNIKRGKYRDK